MQDQLRIGRVLGALMLLHLVLGLIGPYVVLVPMNSAPGSFLTHAAAMADAVRISVLILAIGGLLPIAMAILAWPLWRKELPMLAPWLLALATVNLSLQMVENSHWLSLLSVSQAYGKVYPGASSNFELMAIAIRASFTWAHYTHILILVSWLLTLYLCLYRARTLPRPLAALGIASAVLHMFGIPLPALLGYHMDGASFYGIPLALAYVSTGMWLIWKGALAPTRS